tara:strand:- start:19 stop:234 length:216 start_codon:yes stop_codon:yes gene_type:complete
MDVQEKYYEAFKSIVKREKKLLDKRVRLFKGEVIGWDYTFDCDIEIFVGTDNQIQDYSGCDYETAKKLIGA